ncbi:mucin-2 [Entelurus aequoreus]|uniref:mucin-2 n=1 Tax=Entelurus aequoreus TaxID=161455 RepID=UPI002B1D1BA4|nr:mucin-2 [Entelurus aequoreus]
MSKPRLTPSALIMDIKLADAQRRSKFNGALERSTRPGEEDTLRFLSQEEQECLQFFEETIDSLENSLEEEELRPGLNRSLTRRSLLVDEMDGLDVPADFFTAGTRRLSANDLDIIDLVRPDPHQRHTKVPVFTPSSPDFQTMVVNPESHFEIKPRHDPLDPSGTPSGSYEPADSPLYHPAGCVPTPVIIAKKIAENQAGDTDHSSSFHIHRSQEGERSPDFLTKMGPPTSTKPNRYPANISMILGKTLQNQSIANVNLHDRRAQVLANLTGAPAQEDSKPNLEQMPYNLPARSISFRDPTPDKSRLEALSKLGLARNRAVSGGMSVLDSPSSTTQNPIVRAENSSIFNYVQPSVLPKESSPRVTDFKTTAPPSTSAFSAQPSVLPKESSPLEPKSKTTTSLSTIVSSMQPSVLLKESSPSVPESKTTIPPIPTYVSREAVKLPRSFPSKPPLSPLTLEKDEPEFPPAEVQLNNFGGKSIVVTAVHPNNDDVSPLVSQEAKVLPTALVNSSEFNSYGGKSKVLSPVSPVAMTRSDLPDIVIDVNRPFLSPNPNVVNRYEGKSPTINSPRAPQRSMNGPKRSFKDLPQVPLNSYGGNSPTNNSSRASQCSLDDPTMSVKDLPPPQLNSFGGKSQTTNPSQRSLDGPTRSFKDPSQASLNSSGDNSLTNNSSRASQQSLDGPMMSVKELPPPQLNSFGGKSQTINPSQRSLDGPTRSFKDPPPAKLNSFGGNSPTNNSSRDSQWSFDGPTMSVKDLPPAQLNSFGGKSQTINPSQRSLDSPTRSFKGPPPAPAPRNPLKSYHHVGAATPTRALSPTDYRKTPNVAFRPQGITVQFSGRGAADESRNQALRKLGLLKDS